MGVLETLKLSNAKNDLHLSPVIHRRHKLVDKLHEQLMLAKAMADGKTYEVATVRHLKDRESGLIKKVDGVRQVRKWWFVADGGKVMLQLRYGSKVIELAKGKSSIEVGAVENLIPTIDLIKKAVLDGELDRQLEIVIS